MSLPHTRRRYDDTQGHPGPVDLSGRRCKICEWLIVMWEPLDETLGGRHDRDASETVDAGVAGERLLDHRTLIVKVDRSRGRGGSTMIQGRSESFGENHEPLRGLSYRSVV